MYRLNIFYQSHILTSVLGICHSAGGALLLQKKEFILASNMSSDSVYYQYTTVSVAQD